MSNESLVVAWRQRWNRNLVQFLGRRVRAAVDIEDLAQETYLRLLRARDLSEVRNPQAYLLRVASHVLLEWRDDQPRADAVVTLEDDLLVDECHPEFELEAGLSQQRLDLALATASPMMRAVLLLKLRDERSSQDIANDLDITVRQVKRYLARGYERLRTALEN
ncbi:sigma-70 family RNA polymerase sigma factor [Povalibacter sp.]|uniref:RNA polymerase sigma factor n=1 Tax=Povalibacter sp. TaxID=1962978 RepID=UPI002F4040FC